MRMVHPQYVWMVLFLLSRPLEVDANNRPALCPSPIWFSTAFTVANNSLIGSNSQHLFVDVNDMLYVTEATSNLVHIWPAGSALPIINMSIGAPAARSIFVTGNGDMYIYNGSINGRVERWSPNATSGVTVMEVNGPCFDIAVDVNEDLFCSIHGLHQVVKKPLSSTSNNLTVVAGLGGSGSALHQLNGPRGIFLDESSNLYVTDCNNNRVQLFFAGQMNATTIAINGSSGSFTLNCPSAVVLDAAGYLFIADLYNGRIFGSDATGFHCVAACTGAVGSAANQLSNPHALRFDTSGNLFVADTGNSRVQKFTLITNLCSITAIVNMSMTSTGDTTQISTTTTTTTTYQASSIPAGQPTNLFFAPVCPASSAVIGVSCNHSLAICAALHPCQNNATCMDTNHTARNYTCQCPPHFDGDECQLYSRPCQINSCWNHGGCNETSNTTFSCQCTVGWREMHCETKINYCDNVSCLNNGVCQPLLLNYSCKCLGDSFTGVHCQIVTKKTDRLQKAARSFACIAMIAVISAVLFFVTLDVLKYGFDIDPVHAERQRYVNQSNKAKRRKSPFILYFLHVTGPHVRLEDKIGHK